MNIEELEAKFKEIDERSKFEPVKILLELDTESFDSIKIAVKKTYSLGELKSDEIVSTTNLSWVNEWETLIELKLDDVDISDDYIQEKVRDAFSNRDEFGELPGVKMEQIGSTKYYEVLEDYTYVVKIDSTEEKDYSITALKGYVYDRSSIPRLFWFIIDKDNLSAVPPLFHDLLYQNGGVLPKKQVNPYRTFLREEADNLFYELMWKSGVIEWRCELAYFAVRHFGESSWKIKIINNS